MAATATDRRDIHVIALDETASWHMPEYAEYIERIESVFVYDASVGVHLAEITRSYELWLVDQRAILKDGTPDNIAEDIDGIVSGNINWHDDGVDYMHSSTVDAVVEQVNASSEPFRYYHLGDADPDESMEDIAQSLRENQVI